MCEGRGRLVGHVRESGRLSLGQEVTHGCFTRVRLEGHERWRVLGLASWVQILALPFTSCNIGQINTW